MSKMILAELIKFLPKIDLIGATEYPISGISYDSRKVKSDFLFVAIKGEKFDGHKFIEQAIDKGAIAIVCEELPENFRIYVNVTFIKVKNSRLALSNLSHQFYGNPTKKLKVIGVTGTNGKTTITYILKSMLDQSGEITGLIGTTGIYIGSEKLPSTHTTPESLELAQLFIEMLDKGVTTVVMEVSSHSLHQNRVAGVKFDGAIFSNLTRDHLDYHGTMEEYAAAKKILFQMLPSNAVAVVNSNNKYSKFMVEGVDCKNIVNTGFALESDYLLKDISIGLKGNSFRLISKDKSICFETALIGKFNIENISLASAILLEMGYSEDSIVKGALKTKGAPGRMERYILKNGAVAIVDYAHTPDALENSLFACKTILEHASNSGDLICVFGCGGDRDSGKRPIMGEISTELSDKTIVTSDNPRTEDPELIIHDIEKGIQKSNYSIELDREKAIRAACEYSKSGDIILIAGKGHEKYQIIGTEKIHFDDAEIVKHYL